MYPGVSRFGLSEAKVPEKGKLSTSVWVKTLKAKKVGQTQIPPLKTWTIR